MQGIKERCSVLGPGCTASLAPSGEPTVLLGRCPLCHRAACRACKGQRVIAGRRVRVCAACHAKMPPRQTIALEARFWSKVRKDGPEIRPGLGPCWLWTGAPKPNGYGNIGIGGRGNGTLYAHRLSWQMANGRDPGDLEVCHRCDVRLCVRPDHLFLGTQLDNMADMRTKGRAAIHERHGSAKLTISEVAEIRARSNAGASRASLAREFGVSESTIRSVALHRDWRGV